MRGVLVVCSCSWYVCGVLGLRVRVYRDRGFLVLMVYVACSWFARARGMCVVCSGSVCVCVCVCVCGSCSWFTRAHDVRGMIVVCLCSWCVWRARGLLALVVCVVRL